MLAAGWELQRRAPGLGGGSRGCCSAGLLHPLPSMYPQPLMDTLFCGCMRLQESCEPKHVLAGKLYYQSLCPSTVGPTWMVMGSQGSWRY